jgi:hypothetical protein
MAEPMYPVAPSRPTVSIFALFELVVEDSLRGENTNYGALVILFSRDSQEHQGRVYPREGIVYMTGYSIMLDPLMPSINTVRSDEERRPPTRQPM